MFTIGFRWEKSMFYLKTIRHLLNNINNTFEDELRTKYENQLLCIFASIIIFLVIPIYVLLSHFALHYEPFDIIINTSILFLIFVGFQILLRVKTRVNLASDIITIIYILWFFLSVFRMHHLFGPSIWTLACIMIVISLFRIKRKMRLWISVAVALVSIYGISNYKELANNLTPYFYIPQILMMIVLLLISSLFYWLNTDRHKKMNSQLKQMTAQKMNITTLYDEIAARETELNRKNELLLAYTEELEKVDAQLYEFAYYDQLTKLPNRKLFMEQVHQKVEKAKKNNNRFFLVFLDVDAFKKINDTMGHSVGDEYIKEAINRIKPLLKEDDILSRFGGDEFSLLICRNLTKEELSQELDQIRREFSKVIKIQNFEVRSTASFGVVIYPDDANNVTDLLKFADISMYKAKSMGKNYIQFFEESMKNEFFQKIEMESRLVLAFNNKEFFLVYQPQYSLDGKTIRGIEAFVRWNSPEMGIVEPLQFIPAAEEIGLILPLGELILREACKTFYSLKDKYDLETLTVNVSVVQLMDNNFVEIVKRILNETKLEAKYLEIDIKETVFIESFNQINHVLKELKKMGIRLALDDFGTGYLSLKYLKKLSVDSIKIDRSFINNINNKSFVDSIISIGRNLGVSVIAEGVEHEYQIEYLNNYKCDYAQGYYFNRPLDEKLLCSLLEKIK